MSLYFESECYFDHTEANPYAVKIQQIIVLCIHNKIPDIQNRFLSVCTKYVKNFYQHDKVPSMHVQFRGEYY